MFRKLLVPVDLMDKSQVAIRVAGDLARQSEAGVTLLHVVEVIEHVPFSELEDFYATLEAKAGKALQLRQRELAERGVDSTWKVVFGKRAQAIVGHASEHGFDLIVLASHPVDPQQPGQGFGTLSYKVAILAPCAVLLVK